MANMNNIANLSVSEVSDLIRKEIRELGGITVSYPAAWFAHVDLGDGDLTVALRTNPTPACDLCVPLNNAHNNGRCNVEMCVESALMFETESW